MEQIKETLARIMEEWQALREGSLGGDPDTLLKKILTKKEIRHIKLQCFRQGTLTLLVDSSSWLYYFSLKKEELLLALRKESAKIKNIRFYIGEVP